MSRIVEMTFRPRLPERMLKSGYERMTPEAAWNAVRWWYVHTEPGYVFARGGRCRTARVARREIDAAHAQMKVEREHLPRPPR